MKSFDTIIIGFGKGGKTAAGFLAGHGETVAVIEQSPQMYGGTCINVGCLPSKSLVTWATRHEASTKNDAEKEAYFKKAMERKRALVGALRPKNYHKIADLDTVTVIDGMGRFLSEHEVEVVFPDGSSETLHGNRIIINTGSTPRVPNVPGLVLSNRIVTSEGMLDLAYFPHRLAIVGGGYIGLEFASMMAKFGTAVTVLEQGDRFLPREDRDIAAAVQQRLEELGVTILTGAQVTAMKEEPEHVQVSYQKAAEDFTTTVDTVLVAVGRIANTAGLQLEKAGITADERGCVPVNDKKQTVKEHIWAFGDVNGGLQYTYVSLDDFRIFRDLYNGKTPRTERMVPMSVFIDPPLARVGLTEEEAKAKGVSYQVVTLPVAAIPKANVLQRTTGLMKAIVDTQTGKILGVTLFCEEAHEIINIVKTTMDLGGDYTTLRDQIFTHPTMAEALNDLMGLVRL